MTDGWLRASWAALCGRASRSEWARDQLTRDPEGAALADQYGWSAVAQDAPIPLDRSRNRSERAARGQVFTPRVVADALCALADVAARDRDPRILDPACGDGSLLLAALDQRVAAGWDPSAALVAVTGVDADPAAAFAARAALVSWALDHDAEAEVNIRCADALLGPADAVAGVFGTVLANPPFVEAKRLGAAFPGLALRLRAAHPELSGAFDLYLAFCVRALDQITDDGRIALVLPNKVLMARYAARFRERVERGPVRLAALVDASHVRPRLFTGTGVYPVLLGLGRGSAPVRSARPTTPAALARLDLRDMGMPSAAAWFAPIPETWGLLAPLLAHRPGGAIASFRSACSFHRRGLRERYVTRDRPDGPAWPYLGGPSRARETEVRPFRLRWAGWWIRYDTAALAADGNPLPPLANFIRPKVILCQHGPRLRAWVDADGAYVTKDVYPVVWPSDPAWDVWTLGAVLNSTVFTALYNTLFHGVTCGSETYHYLPALLASVPVPPIAELAGVGDLARAAQNGDPDAWDAADRRVTAAYALDEAARALLAHHHLHRVGAEAPTSPRSPSPT